MSAIFGIINLNDAPVQHSDMQKMKDAMDYWGPDGNYIWVEGNAGLGQLQLFNTPESEFERFPLIDPSGNLIFVTTCRIDNRDELFHKLGIPYEKRYTQQHGHYTENQRNKVVTDAELIFLSYQKYGKDCVHHLLGDWSFAVWDKVKKELFLARDHFGVTGIYYYLLNNELVFSSSLKSITNLRRTSIDEDFIEALILNTSNQEVRTAYKKINKLPISSYLSITKSHICKTIKYHHIKNTKNNYYQNYDEYVKNFQLLLKTSIHCRLRSIKAIGSTLSSGLDSTTITSLAALDLMNDNKHLTAFTAIPKYETNTFSNRLPNEEPLASLITNKYKNIEKVILKPNYNLFESINFSLDIHGQPVFSASNAHWILSILKESQNRNISTLLIGQIGNLTISWKDKNIGSSTYSYFLDQRSFRNSINNFKFHYFNNIASISSLLKVIDPPKFTKNSIIRTKILNNYLNLMNRWQENGAPYAIEVRDPSLDKRIIDFCFSVPENLFYEKARDRKLLKDCITEFIPQEIINNKLRGLQASDLKELIRVSQNEIIRFFEENKKSNPFRIKNNIYRYINHIDWNKISRKDQVFVCKCIMISSFFNL